MTSDALADLVVATLNALVSPPLNFQAINPPEMATADAERSNFAVFAIPFSETESSFDRGNTCREDRVVSVVVNGPLDMNVTRAKALEFVEFLRLGLRGTELGGYLWADNETVSIFDTEALKTKNQFLSLFRASYYRFG